jgi:hypothetical protein
MSAAYEQYRELLTSSQFDEAARMAGSEYLKDNADNPFWLTKKTLSGARNPNGAQV